MIACDRRDGQKSKLLIIIDQKASRTVPNADDFRQKRAKLQINTFLLAHDLHRDKSKWTGKHRQWLSKTNFSESCVQIVFTELYGHLEYLEARISHLDSQIEEIGRSEIYGPSVKKLRAFKGIGTLAAMLLILLFDFFAQSLACFELDNF